MNAADVMVANVITVRSDTPVERIAETLLANRISAVPVLDADDKLVGIVSEGDLIHRVETGTERHRSWWLELLTNTDTLAHEFIKSHARQAADLMSHPVITVRPDTPLDELAALLDKHRIKRVPVVANGKLVGIVSRANLIQALIRRRPDSGAGKVDDETLHANILAQLRQHPWWSDDVNVVVRDGKVELWGIVETEAQRDAIRVAVEGVPGVRGISNNLAVDDHLSRGQ
jgi:predicted transcriptional regulator